jgi:hypothetical protein
LRRCHQTKISRATITISMTSNSKPRIEAKPAMPPKSPCANSMPNRPAPRKPAAMPPNKPPPNKPGRIAVWPMGAALPGCVIEFWIGAAVGAVGVAGGAENVRIPRLPPEEPPPTRACASAVTSTSTAAIAVSAISQRWQNMTFISRLRPPQPELQCRRQSPNLKSRTKV